MNIHPDQFCAALRADLDKRYFTATADSQVGPDGERSPSRQILLALAWMQEVTAYWQRQYDSWPASRKRIADIAKRMCKSDPNEIVQGNDWPAPIVKMANDKPAIHLPNLIGTAVPVWVRHMQMATDAIALVEPPEFDATKLAPLTRLMPVPPETLVVEP